MACATAAHAVRGARTSVGAGVPSHLESCLERGQAIAGHQPLVALHTQAARVGLQGLTIGRSRLQHPWHQSVAPGSRPAAAQWSPGLRRTGPLHRHRFTPLATQPTPSLPYLVPMTRCVSKIMPPSRSVLPCQFSTLHTRARARGSPAPAQQDKLVLRASPGGGAGSAGEQRSVQDAQIAAVQPCGPLLLQPVEPTLSKRPGTN